MAKPVILTVEGLETLEKELETLKTVTRKEVSEKIKVALSFGDLSENSEYDEAKNEQAMVESRVNEIEQLLKNATVLDEDGLSTDIVGIGTKVTVLNIDKDKEVEYKIVGSTEASPLEKRISDESPVGKALLGHRLNDVIEISAPVGIVKMKIIKIGK